VAPVFSNTYNLIDRSRLPNSGKSSGKTAFLFATGGFDRQFVHLVGRLALGELEDVLVDVLRQADGVSHDVGDHLQWHALRTKQRDRGLAQVVKALLWQTGGFDDCVELAQCIAIIDGRADR